MEPRYALRTLVRPAYSNQGPRFDHVAPYASYAPSHPSSGAVEDSVMHDARVRPAYRGLSAPIKGMRGFRENLLISSRFSCVLPRFPCPFKPEALAFLLKSRRSILLPRFPRIPRKIRFPRRNSARFSISLSSNFQVSSYPLINLFKLF